MDGTLTIPAHDFDHIREALSIENGVPILEAIAAMPESQAAIARQKLHQMELDIAADAKAQPDALWMLDRLCNRGAKLAILTRNARDIAEVTLQAAGIKEYFRENQVIGREQCAPKPDPAGINLLMKTCQSQPGDTIMVGDYVFDLQAGRNAGVSTVHFDPSAEHAWPELTDFKIEALRQLTPDPC